MIYNGYNQEINLNGYYLSDSETSTVEGITPLTEEEMKVNYNQMMLKEVGISKEDLYSMAVHVVYSLYDGEFPEGL